MSDEVREEDEWLYGDSESFPNITQQSQQRLEDEHVRSSQSDTEVVRITENDEIVSALTKDSDSDPNITQVTGDADQDEGEEEEDDDEEDDSDDDDGVQVTIGEIKAAASTPFGTAPAKRLGPPPDKKGKFSVEDFESPGTINGVPATDFNIDSVEDKPWRKPGADITDYFNYGFSEDTWRSYCDRQKRIRFEAGSGGLGSGPMNPPGKPDSRGIIAVQINNDNSKYGGSGGNAAIIFPKKFGINPMRNKEEIRRREEPKENTIQVMTADRREYSRKNFDMPPPTHVPPPFAPPPFDTSVPPPSFPPPGPDYLPNPEYFNHPPPHYFHEDHSGYEEQQWMESGWDMSMDMSRPPPGSAVVPLTKASNVPPPPGEGESTPPSISSIKEETPGEN